MVFSVGLFLEIVEEFQSESYFSLLGRVLLLLESVHPLLSTMSKSRLNQLKFFLLRFDCLASGLLMLSKSSVQVIQVLSIIVKLDALLLSLGDQVLGKLPRVESGLQSGVRQILLEDHLVESVLEEDVHLKVGAFLLKPILSSILKLDQQTHDTGLIVYALMSEHVKFLFLGQ